MLTSWATGTPHLPGGEGRPQLGPRAHTLKGFRTPHSACDALSSAAALKETRKGETGGKNATTARRAAAPYSKFWEEVDTERGRFGTSVDDNALPASSTQSTAAGVKSAAVGGNMRAAAVAAGVRGVGKAGVHWGNHHHHHHHHHQPARSDEGKRGHNEGQVVDKEKLRQLYLLSARPNAAAAAQRERAKIQVRVSGGVGVGVGAGNAYGQGRGSGNSYGRGSAAYGRGYHSVSGGNVHGRGGITSTAATAAARGVSAPLVSHRSVPDAWVAARAAAAEQSGAATSGVRRISSSAHGWESHTLQAQQKTQEYMQGREDLAPDMRPDVVLDNEVSGGGASLFRRLVDHQSGVSVWSCACILTCLYVPRTKPSTVCVFQLCHTPLSTLETEVNLPSTYLLFIYLKSPQVSLAYDVDVSDAGMLGAGAYGTVLAAVHRSTGRQVAIKTMLKKYLLSDAEKASVEREIEIQKVSAFCVLGG